MKIVGLCFAKVAFARDNGRCPNDIESVGKEIVARCGGLPLAIKAVGGMMQGKRCSIYEWRRISEHLKAELAEKKNDVQIISSLELSYDELPNYLRPCFLCFSMFPKDYEIDIDDIILLWIGEGFVSGRNGRTALEVGGECATELINRCLLVGERKDAFEREFITVKIHDIVRYMAIKIARDENFASLDEVGTPEFSVRARRATIFQSDGGLNLNHSATDSKLRTLFGRNVGMHVILNQELEPCKMKRLRVLHVSFIYHDLKDQEGIVTDFLNGLASLSYLIVLKMGNCAFPNLPDSIGELHNLQILCLYRWVKLKILPPSITKLDKLTIFRIYGCPLLEHMPDGIGRLSNMEKLSGFKPAILSYGNSSRFDELKNLLQLRELHVNLTNPDQLEEGELNLLSGLQNLQALVIEFLYGAEAKSLESKVNYHQLSPLRRLEVLSIYHCPEKSTPVWLNPTSFPNLQFLEILNGRFTRMGPEFWETHVGVWKIERLLFSCMGEFEEEWERFVEALPSLRMVKVSLCPNFKSFPLDATAVEAIWRKEEENATALALVKSEDPRKEEDDATGLAQVKAEDPRKEEL